MGQLNIVQEVWIKGRIAHEVHLFCPVLLKLGTPQGQTNGRCVMAIAGTCMPDCKKHIPHPSLQPQGIHRPTLPCCRAFWLFSGILNTPSVYLCVPLFLPKSVHPQSKIAGSENTHKFYCNGSSKIIVHKVPGPEPYFPVPYNLIHIPLPLSFFSPSLASTLSDR